MATVLTTSTANDPMTNGLGAQSPMHATGVDPFLGHGGNITESHARQNSADSGLGKIALLKYIHIYIIINSHSKLLLKYSLRL